LWRQYDDPTKEQRALDDYDNLKLEPGDDFLSFKNDFVRLAGETEKPRSTWKHEFNRKLYDSFQRSMVPSFANPAVTFDRFVIEAQQIAIINKRASERQAANRQNRNNATRGNRGGARATRSPARKQGAAVKKPLSADDVKQLYKEGRCFTCREKGHHANECPQERKDDKPRGSGRDHDAVIAYLQKRWATKPSEQSPKEDDASDKTDDSASEQGN
jgi:Zinc knuckle